MLGPSRYKNPDVIRNTDSHTDSSVGHARPVWTQDLVVLLSHGGAGFTRDAPAHTDRLHTVNGTATSGPGDGHTGGVEALTPADTGVTQASARL